GPVSAGLPSYYEWQGGGGPLSNVALRCPQGGAQVNFGVAYGRDWKWSERFPERGPSPVQSSLNIPARIIQRGAANLRMPVVVSALTIPPLSSRLHNLLQDTRLTTLCSTLIGMNLLTEANFRQGLTIIQPPLGASVIQFIQGCSWPEIEAAIQQVLAQVTATNRSIKEEEFESLRFAAANGAPPIPSPQVGVPPLFEVRLADIRRFRGIAGRHLIRVVPVSRLRMVLVQTGYRRIDPTNGQMVSVAFQSGGRTWYPGVELFGEGIYL